MPLTPADVHNVAFSKPPIGKRGYNEDEVDQFLDLVEDTLAQLQDENDELRSRLAEGGQAAVAAAPVKRSDDSEKVDEAAIRREVEQKVRSDFEAQLRSAKQAQEKAEAEARSAKDEAAKARKQAEEAAKAPKQATAPAAAASQPAGSDVSADTS